MFCVCFACACFACVLLPRQASRLEKQRDRASALEASAAQALAAQRVARERETRPLSSLQRSRQSSSGPGRWSSLRASDPGFGGHHHSFHCHPASPIAEEDDEYYANASPHLMGGVGGGGSKVLPLYVGRSASPERWGNAYAEEASLERRRREETSVRRALAAQQAVLEAQMASAEGADGMVGGGGGGDDESGGGGAEKPLTPLVYPRRTASLGRPVDHEHTQHPQHTWSLSWAPASGPHAAPAVVPGQIGVSRQSRHSLGTAPPAATPASAAEVSWFNRGGDSALRSASLGRSATVAQPLAQHKPLERPSRGFSEREPRPSSNRVSVSPPCQPRFAAPAVLTRRGRRAASSPEAAASSAPVAAKVAAAAVAAIPSSVEKPVGTPAPKPAAAPAVVAAPSPTRGRIAAEHAEAELGRQAGVLRAFVTVHAGLSAEVAEAMGRLGVDSIEDLNDPALVTDRLLMGEVRRGGA